MPRYVLLMVTALTLIFITACSNQTGEIRAGIGEEVSLSEGQTAAIQGESLKIKFIDVTNDSRCPTGVACIWAGEVKCNVELTDIEGVELRTLVQSGGTSGYASTTFNEYRISFNVQPYPAAGKEISQEEYRLLLNVTK